MQTSLLVSAFIMGLVGGPHCLAMCGAACAGMGRLTAPHPGRGILTFQVSRLIGYTVLGAVAAGTVQGFAWMGSHTTVIRPLWTALHVVALVLGVGLMMSGHQPAWVDGLAQSVWRRIKPRLQALGGKAPVLLGLGWAFMPCGLLYSALLVASLSATVADGALVMTAFALGSGLLLFAGPWMLVRLGLRPGGADWGIRLGGAALAVTSGWALWMGVTQPTGLWCA